MANGKTNKKNKAKKQAKANPPPKEVKPAPVEKPNPSSSKKNSKKPKKTQPNGGQAPRNIQVARPMVKGTNTTMAGFYDPSTSSHEIRFKVTDYFDSFGVSANPRVSYLFKPEQSMLIGSPDSGMNANLLVVNHATFYALPGFDLITSSSAKLIAFALPVKINPETNRSACQKTTLLTPSSVSNWVKVGHWSASQVFRDTLVGPAYNDFNYQCLGTLAVLNPDNMEYSDEVIQFRVEYEVQQTIQPVAELFAGVSEGGSSSWSTPPDVALAQNSMLIDVVGLGNSR